MTCGPGATDKHKRLDDYAFGGGAGMVMMIEPIHRAIEQLKAERTYDEVIYMSPDGDLLDQPMANRMSTLKNLIILCGHYKGVDERVREHLITREISIGDYVLSGGELPAAVLSDTLIRLLPGVLGDETSALSRQLPGWPGGPSRLYPAGRLPRLESAGCPLERARGQDR